MEKRRHQCELTSSLTETETHRDVIIGKSAYTGCINTSISQLCLLRDPGPKPGFLIPFYSKRNQGSLGKHLNPGLRQGISNMSLEHLRVPESKEVPTEPTLTGGVAKGPRSQWEEPKPQQCGQQNK